MKNINTEEQLKANITHELIESNYLYYSIAKKSKGIFSVFGTDRLLIFNYTKGILYYNNELNITPFKTFVPAPKN
jgi:hypothetical protein